MRLVVLIVIVASTFSGFAFAGSECGKEMQNEASLKGRHLSLHENDVFWKGSRIPTLKRGPLINRPRRALDLMIKHVRRPVTYATFYEQVKPTANGLEPEARIGFVRDIVAKVNAALVEADPKFNSIAEIEDVGFVWHEGPVLNPLFELGDLVLTEESLFWKEDRIFELEGTTRNEMKRKVIHFLAKNPDQLFDVHQILEGSGITLPTEKTNPADFVRALISETRAAFRANDSEFEHLDSIRGKGYGWNPLPKPSLAPDGSGLEFEPRTRTFSYRHERLTLLPSSLLMLVTILKAYPATVPDNMLLSAVTGKPLREKLNPAEKRLLRVHVFNLRNAFRPMNTDFRSVASADDKGIYWAESLPDGLTDLIHAAFPSAPASEADAVAP